MSDARAQFLEAYDRCRVQSQAAWYERRAAEYERSADQIGWINEILLFLAAACGAVAAVWTDQAVWLGVAAAALSAVAGAAIAWADVVGFAANAELYTSATGALAHLRPTRPQPEGDATDEDVERYVSGVEQVLLGEVRTWGERWGSPGHEPAS